MVIFQHCKNCGAQISAKATTCPHCKTVLMNDEPEPKPKRKKSSKNVWKGIKGLPKSGHRPPRRRVTGWTILGILFLSWIVYAVVAPNPGPNPGAVGPDGIAGWETMGSRDRAGGGHCGDRIDAFTFAEILIRRKLKNPEGAKFSLMDARIKMSECGQWRVASHVDATNSFGAVIRTKFIAVVRRVSDNRWHLESLDMM